MSVAVKQRWSNASRRSKGLVLGGGVAVVALAAGGAYALWSATGEGEGRASATNAVELTVDAATGTADLYPGFTDGDVYFTITNPNPYPVTFTGATVGAVTSETATCDAANVTVETPGVLSIAVPADDTTGTLSIADIVTMSVDAPDGCQGASFLIPLTLTGTQTTP